MCFVFFRNVGRVCTCETSDTACTFHICVRCAIVVISLFCEYGDSGDLDNCRRVCFPHFLYAFVSLVVVGNSCILCMLCNVGDSGDFSNVLNVCNFGTFGKIGSFINCCIFDTVGKFASFCNDGICGSCQSFLNVGSVCDFCSCGYCV